jgi:Domain of unknown function DUF1828
MNCQWAQALTRYDCRPVKGTDGGACLEIGTPFSLPDGSAINLYLSQIGEHIRISDNADTVFQLGGMGLELWAPGKLARVREVAMHHKLSVGDNGEIFVLARAEHAAAGFAIAVTGLLNVSRWAAERMGIPELTVDLVAEMQPFVVARDPNARFELKPHVLGASRTDHVFDFRHGDDLIDVITASAQATGGVMRKVSDVQNGPFVGDASPLIIVDDRQDKRVRAENEIAILGAVTRAMPLSSLLSVRH